MRLESHLTDALLVKALDGELSGGDKAEVEIHLASCQECLDRLDRWADLSTEIARVVDAVPTPAARQSHDRLVRAMANAYKPYGAVKQARRGRTFAWAAALAACLAIVTLFSVRLMRHLPKQHEEPAAIAANGGRHAPSPAAIAHVRPDQPVKRRPVLARNKVPAKLKSVSQTADDGFWPLPYSNPALPVDASDVLRVRVRLSALTAAGVVSSAPASDDPWVQADVLLGADGEPRGIRLLQAAATE